MKSKYESEAALLENLEEVGDMNDAMRRAAAIGDETSAKRLLSRGVDVNLADDSGYSAFMYCCGQGHLGIAELMIVAGGANVDDQDSKSPPLVLATNNAHVGIIRLLIEHGATVDRWDELARTPLLIACERSGGECARVLLSSGADPNATDRRGNTGLHHAAVSGDDGIARLLIDHGANQSIKNNDHMTALAIARSRRHFKVVSVLAITKGS